MELCRGLHGQSTYDAPATSRHWFTAVGVILPRFERDGKKPVWTHRLLSEAVSGCQEFSGYCVESWHCCLQMSEYMLTELGLPVMQLMIMQRICILEVMGY